jgi:hypothetical protein
MEGLTRWRPPRPTKDRVSMFRSLQGLGAPSPRTGPAFGRKKDRTLGAQLFSHLAHDDPPSEMQRPFES